MTEAMTIFTETLETLKSGYENGEVLADEIKEARALMNEVGKTVTASEKAKKKVASEEEKEELAKAGKELAQVGSTVTFAYKDDTIEGLVVKTNEKTFTCEINVDGETKKIWRYYHQVVTD